MSKPPLPDKPKAGRKPTAKRAAMKPRTPLQMLKAGCLPPVEYHSHQDWVRDLSDPVLDVVRKTLGRQNLSDLTDEETRWKAERLSWVRMEIRRRAIENLSPAPCV